MSIHVRYIILLGCVTFFSCSENKPEQFTLLEKNKTGIDFRNMLKEDEKFNIFKYQYYYNGGGVAVADFNNDGLQDVFFTGNMVKNRLFINEGDLEFKDVTTSSGVAVNEGWCTGANAVDINNDGWMDIYVCRAGYPFEKLRKNLLLINNGNLTFTDKANEYGLDDNGYSTQSAFFDFDKDGDLDMFLLNHSAPEYSKGSLEIFSLKQKRDPQLESKLFRNDKGKFVNISEAAGIKGNVLGFSLGLGVIDINNDGWTDIFIGNDFNESDYLFINNGDGTFTEKSKSTFDHTAMFSMGCDIADINNDQQMDLISLDMLPESNYLQKLHSGADNYTKISNMFTKGFNPQFSKNVLQINNGDGSFSECAQMYGVSNTDWSWASLFMDFDHDTYQDLFISNGYFRDHTDMDFLQFTADQVIKADKGEDPVTFEKYMASMPPINQPNYFFKSENGKRFINKNADWKLTKPSISGAAAYADLDNDGDLDIITTNVGDYAFVYKNNQKNNTNNFLNIKLKGAPLNLNGIGARVTLYAEGKIFTKDLQPCRGFQSSVESKLFFGLGHISKIDSIIIYWPDGRVQKDIKSKVNKLNEISYMPNGHFVKPNGPTALYYQDQNMVTFTHNLDQFDDFKVQGLLPYYLTDRGPKICVSDFNGDGLEDFILTGNSVTKSKLYLQSYEGNFASSDLPIPLVEISDIDILKSTTGKSPDIIISVGSYKYSENDQTKGVYIYKNNGKASFTNAQFIKTPDINPTAICVLDVTNGIQDIVIGGSCHMQLFPTSTPTCILHNNGKNQFEIVEASKINLGIVNDIITYDINNDKKQEVIICGDWMPVKIFNIENGTWKDVTSSFFDKQDNGLWKRVHIAELSGVKYLICGNLGINSQLTASRENPMKLYYEDYDQNGSIDPILAHYIMDGTYPFTPREDMIKQVPMLNKRFHSFGLFAKADIKTLLGDEVYNKAKPLEVHTLSSSIYRFEGSKWIPIDLDQQVQIAPVFSIQDIPIGNSKDRGILLAGNQTRVRVKLGHLNGNHGMVVTPSKKNKTVLDNTVSGFDVRGDVRDVRTVKSTKGDLVIFATYGQDAKFYRSRLQK